MIALRQHVDVAVYKTGAVAHFLEAEAARIEMRGHRRAALGADAGEFAGEARRQRLHRRLGGVAQPARQPDWPKAASRQRIGSVGAPFHRELIGAAGQSERQGRRRRAARKVKPARLVGYRRHRPSPQPQRRRTRPVVREVLADRKGQIDAGAAMFRGAGDVGDDTVAGQHPPQPQNKCIEIGDRKRGRVQRLAVLGANKVREQVER